MRRAYNFSALLLKMDKGIIEIPTVMVIKVLGGGEIYGKSVDVTSAESIDELFKISKSSKKEIPYCLTLIYYNVFQMSKYQLCTEPIHRH